MNTQPTKPTLHAEDGPATCIWKVMEGRGWMSVADIIGALREAGCHYAVTTLRNKIFAMARNELESQEPTGQGPYGNFKLYRTPLDAIMPENLDKKTRPKMVVRAKTEELTEARRKASMDTAVDHMSAMMMAFVKPKNQQ